MTKIPLGKVIGPKGEQGIRGEKGEIGPQGIQGIPGNPGDLTWVSGVMQNTSVPSSAYFVVTPVFAAGNKNLLSGNKFVAESNGIWELYVGCYKYPITVDNYNCICKNGVQVGANYSLFIATRRLEHRLSSDVNAVVNLNKGDYLHSVLWLRTAVASNSFEGEVPFVFRRVA